jgi:hypothetical protein
MGLLQVGRESRRWGGVREEGLARGALSLAGSHRGGQCRQRRAHGRQQRALLHQRPRAHLRRHAGRTSAAARSHAHPVLPLPLTPSGRRSARQRSAAPTQPWQVMSRKRNPAPRQPHAKASARSGLPLTVSAPPYTMPGL